MKLYFILTSEKTNTERTMFSDFIKAESAAGKGREYLVVTDDSELYRQCAGLGIPSVGVLSPEEIMTELEFDRCSFPGAEYLVAEPNQVEDDEYYRIWKRLRGESLIVGETTRCILRESKTEDVGVLAAIFASVKDDDLTKVPFTETETGVGFLEDYIQNQYKVLDFGNWTVVEKRTGKIIGWAGLSLWDGEGEEEVGGNLSYIIASDYRGHGYGTEVSTEILRLGFEKYDMKSICVIVSDRNAASRGVCEKLMKTVSYNCRVIGKQDKTIFVFSSTT